MQKIIEETTTTTVVVRRYADDGDGTATTAPVATTGEVASNQLEADADDTADAGEPVERARTNAKDCDCPPVTRNRANRR